MKIKYMDNAGRRCTHPDDKRCTVISITDLGKQLFEAIFPDHLKDLEICFSALSEEEKNTLIALLKKAT